MYITATERKRLFGGFHQGLRPLKSLPQWDSGHFLLLDTSLGMIFMMQVNCFFIAIFIGFVVFVVYSRYLLLFFFVIAHCHCHCNLVINFQLCNYFVGFLSMYVRCVQSLENFKLLFHYLVIFAPVIIF